MTMDNLDIIVHSRLNNPISKTPRHFFTPFYSFLFTSPSFFRFFSLSIPFSFLSSHLPFFLLLFPIANHPLNPSHKPWPTVTPTTLATTSRRTRPPHSSYQPHPPTTPRRTTASSTRRLLPQPAPVAVTPAATPTSAISNETSSSPPTSIHNTTTLPPGSSCLRKSPAPITGPRVQNWISSPSISKRDTSLGRGSVRTYTNGRVLLVAGVQMRRKRGLRCLGRRF